MKILIPAGLIFIFTVQISRSQPYEPLVRDSAHWVVATWSYQVLWYYYDFREYYFDGDTTIAGNAYKKVYKYHLEPENLQIFPPYMRTGDPILFGAIREDTIERKVWGIRFTTNTYNCYYNEELMFDYSVELGDTLELCQAFLGPLFIDDIYYDMEYGYYRKHFSGGYNFPLIEGIGSGYGLFEAIGMTFKNSKEGAQEELRCYTIGDISGCDIVTGTGQIAENRFQMYPNPLKGDFLYLKLPEAENQRCRAEVADIFGKTLRLYRLDCSVEKIDLSSLQPGIYLIRIYNENALLTTQKLIKL